MWGAAPVPLEHARACRTSQPTAPVSSLFFLCVRVRVCVDSRFQLYKTTNKHRPAVVEGAALGPRRLVLVVGVETDCVRFQPSRVARGRFPALRCAITRGPRRGLTVPEEQPAR